MRGTSFTSCTGLPCAAKQCHTRPTPASMEGENKLTGQMVSACRCCAHASSRVRMECARGLSWKSGREGPHTMATPIATTTMDAMTGLEKRRCSQKRSTRHTKGMISSFAIWSTTESSAISASLQNLSRRQHFIRVQHDRRMATEVVNATEIMQKAPSIAHAQNS